MLKIIISLLDILYPPRFDEQLIRKLDCGRLEALYRPNQTHNTTYLQTYDNPSVRALIAENKFNHNPLAARLLAEQLHRYLNSLPDSVVLIPIPLGKRRYKERGYNQVLEIVKKMPISENYQICTDLLSRKLETIPQTSLTRAERLRNMVGAFQCSPKYPFNDFKNKTVVLVDDVVTTGSTLAVARATLAPLLPTSTIVCVALAH